MKKFILVSGLFLMTLAGCASHSPNPSQLNDEKTINQLRQVDSPYFDSVYARASADTKTNKKVFLGVLDMSEVEIAETFKYRSSLSEKWELTQEDVHQFQDLYSAVVSNFLEGTEAYEITTNESEADLIIASKLTRIAPAAPKDDFKSRPAGAKYYTEGSGSMSISVEIFGGDVLLMQIKDTRDAGYLWERNTRFSNKQNTKRLFRSWAKSLSNVL